VATPPNDDTRMLFKLIADREWHSYEEIRDKVAEAVPPGRALRKYQERIAYARQQKNDPGYDTDLTEDERIFYGQRGCAQGVITSWKGRGLQFQGEGKDKVIRIRPGFKTWGVDVVGEKAENEETPPDPSPADSEPPEADQDPQEEAPVIETPFPVTPAHVPAPLAQAVDNWVKEKLGPREPDEPGVYYDHTSQPVTEKPGEDMCEICGLAILNWALHQDWHSRFEEVGSRSDMALFSESEVRTLLGDVMQQELDNFQGGMSIWLETQFADIHAALRALRRPQGRWSDGDNRGPFTHH
jgi:hypothetical protein